VTPPLPPLKAVMNTEHSPPIKVAVIFVGAYGRVTWQTATEIVQNFANHKFEEHNSE